MSTTNRTESTFSISRVSRRSRLAATFLGSTLVAGTLAVGVGAVGAEDPPPATPKPVAITVMADPHVTLLYTPANLTITGSATLNEPATGMLKVSLHGPRTAEGADCSGPVHKSGQASLTKPPTPTPTPTTPAVAVTATVVVPATIKATDKQGFYQWQATFTPNGGGEVVKSICYSTLVAHRQDTDPPKPNDPKPTPTAIQAQVTKQFRLMLGRDPSQLELTTWTGRVQAGTATIPVLVADLRNSPEHVNVVDPVTRLYFAYFLRTPDADGLDFWIAQRKSGRSLISISEFFSRSPEFDRRYGSLGNGGFVDLIYRNILERTADDKGKSFWIAQLDQGARTRGDVMVGFSESPEYREAVANEVHVAVLFALLLDRAPTSVEFASVVDLLDLRDTAKPFTVADLAKDLIERRTTVR